MSRWAAAFQRAIYQFTARARHRAAWSVREAEDGRSLDVLDGHRHCLVVSFDPEGRPVPTPVWFGVTQGRMYFRSAPDAAKVERIRRHPGILIAPCDARGKPVGPALAASVVEVSGPDADTAEQAISSRQGLQRDAFMRTVGSRVPGVYFMATPAAVAGSTSSAQD